MIRKRRRLREYRRLKAENDRIFWRAYELAPEQLRGKARLRFALDVLRLDDDYQREKELWRLLFCPLEIHA